MDTLQERLADLADEAPIGGPPPAELWARGKRTHRRRVATVAAALLVTGVLGTGIGVGLVDDGRGSPDPPPAETERRLEVGFELPIEYQVGQQLPDLGDTPGPLAAVLVVPRGTTEASDVEVVGVVAETGMVGRLPIDLMVWPDPDPRIADALGEVELSPDGRTIAYWPPTEELVVRDLVSGEAWSWPGEFGTRGTGRWIDSTHLLGHVAGGSDADGWLWEPGTVPERVNVYAFVEGFSYPFLGQSFWVHSQGVPRPCSPPVLENPSGRFEVPVLCEVLGAIDSGTLLGYWNSPDPDDQNRTVVALDIRGATAPGSPPRRNEVRLDDPSRLQVVLTEGAHLQVSVATDLIGAALSAEDGAS